VFPAKTTLYLNTKFNPDPNPNRNHNSKIRYHIETMVIFTFQYKSPQLKSSWLYPLLSEHSEYTQILINKYLQTNSLEFRVNNCPGIEHVLYDITAS